MLNKTTNTCLIRVPCFPSQQQQQQVHKQGPGSQQAMIRAVMDPPFLQASGEYTLFSNNSSPAWPTSLVKNTNQMLKAASSKGWFLELVHDNLQHAA